MSQSARSVSADNRDAPHQLMPFRGEAHSITSLEQRLDRVEAHLEASQSLVEQQAAAIGSLCCDLARMRRTVHRNPNLLSAPAGRMDVARANWEAVKLMRSRGDLTADYFVRAVARTIERR